MRVNLFVEFQKKISETISTKTLIFMYLGRALNTIVYLAWSHQ